MIRAFVMLLILIALTVAMCSLAWSAMIKLQWNANPVTENVTGYEVKAQEVFGLREWRISTTETKCTLNELPNAPCFFSVRATNTKGWSDFSPTITATPREYISLTLQHGDDLSGWSDVPNTPPILRPITTPKKFFRLKIEPTQP